MTLINALFRHVCLIAMLKHDGKGMPVKIPASFALICFYILLTLANQQSGEIKLETVLGLAFIAQFYLFGLRNQLISLIIMIAIFSNLLLLSISSLTGIPEAQLQIVLVYEYIMVFCAVINVIKSNLHIHS